MPITRRAAGLAVTALGAVAAVLLAGCSGSSSPASSASASATSAPSGAASGAGTSATASSAQPTLSSDKQTYVSIGDSYAAGYQPTGRGKGGTTRNGFAYQVVQQAAAKNYDFTLVNFACSGATTTSALKQRGCKDRSLGPGAASYGTLTQAAAAEKYLRAHRDQVGLVTVSLGGNDVTACADAATTAAATGCVSSALNTITTNLKTLLTGLRAAAGPATRIVGITYPDIFLGEALSKVKAKQELASLSVFAFKSLINPQLKSAYEQVGGAFADVTAATGAYGDLTRTTTLAPYGTIPVPVAQVCRLTFYCQYEDIHPRTNGYRLIADLVVTTLPAR